jgi:hypothetical protein
MTRLEDLARHWCTEHLLATSSSRDEPGFAQMLEHELRTPDAQVATIALP